MVTNWLPTADRFLIGSNELPVGYQIVTGWLLTVNGFPIGNYYRRHITSWLSNVGNQLVTSLKLSILPALERRGVTVVRFRNCSVGQIEGERSSNSGRVLHFGEREIWQETRSPEAASKSAQSGPPAAPDLAGEADLVPRPRRGSDPSPGPIRHRRDSTLKSSGVESCWSGSRQGE
ncbi:hypothetical protein TIFTF001_005604 [Ficus carica]|uniref:Uncharacterized protein n=1 Tax=Ficus carica TaxID=3494 RepID=A0AA88CV29_FICCA|nr:hypothetical protein TIFTF001_005604 [Ficus carica]